MKPSQEKRGKNNGRSVPRGKRKAGKGESIVKPKDKDTSKWRKWSVMSNSRGKLARNLKVSIEFCKKVAIYDLPGSTLNEVV